MLQYKVHAQEINGRCHLVPYGEDRVAAEKMMHNLASEKEPKTEWAELYVSGGSGLEWDPEYGFEREVKTVGGERRFTGRIIWF